MIRYEFLTMSDTYPGSFIDDNKHFLSSNVVVRNDRPNHDPPQRSGHSRGDLII
jgi:hypothetical protein